MELENAHLLSHYCHCDRRTNTTDVNELVGDSFEVAHFGDLGGLEAFRACFISFPSLLPLQY